LGERDGLVKELTGKVIFDKFTFGTLGISNAQASRMYRIVKRIVRTITTVTWLVRWEGSHSDEQITLPASHSLTEEEVPDTTIHLPDEVQTGHTSKPISDHEGEKS
jgi:hypothetical protein